MKTRTLSFILIVTISSACVSQSKTEQYFKPKYIKSAMTRAALWQLANPLHELWDWTNGAFYAGVSATYITTENIRLLEAMIEMGEKNQWKPGPRLHHADDHAIAQTYLDIYRIKKDERMINPFKEQIDLFIATPYLPEGIAQITWWWCDALFMAPPALVKLSVITGDDKYINKCDTLFHECYNMLYDTTEHLFARDLNYIIRDDANDRYEANGKKIFWSRGNGWVMAGLTRMLLEMPGDYAQREFYEKLFREMAAKIASLQQGDGLWRASLLDPDSYPGGEASGTGFYTYSLAWGINNGLLNEDEYLPVVKKAWNGLQTLIQPEGYIGWCQPIGGDPRRNFTETSWEVYGTGAFLLAGSEVIKLKIKD